MDGEGSDGFIWAAERAAGVARAGRFPPDEVLDLPSPLSFTRVLAALVLAGAAVDVALVGTPPTGVPYNYPAAVAVGYALLALWALRRTHDAIDRVGRDAVAIARRTSADAALRPREVQPDVIANGVDALRRQAFHPAVVLGGAAIGAGVTVWARSRLGLTGAYPYLVIGAIYGGAHGLFVGPAVATLLSGARLADRYAVGFDAFAPDGAGGYRRLGRALAGVVVDWMALVTLDLVVLASVGYVRGAFLPAALAWYGLGLLLLAGLAIAGTAALGRRLRRVREETAGAMRLRFDEAATRFWRAADGEGDPRPAADAIGTMATLLDRLRRTSPWPVGRWAIARLVAATILSLAVAAAVLSSVPATPV